MTEKLQVFGFCTEVEGGTFISQIAARDVDEAARIFWQERVEPLRSADAEGDECTPIQDMDGVWFWDAIDDQGRSWQTHIFLQPGHISPTVSVLKEEDLGIVDMTSADLANVIRFPETFDE